MLQICTTVIEIIDDRGVTTSLLLHQPGLKVGNYLQLQACTQLVQACTQLVPACTQLLQDMADKFFMIVVADPFLYCLFLFLSQQDRLNLLAFARISTQYVLHCRQELKVGRLFDSVFHFCSFSYPLNLTNPAAE